MAGRRARRAKEERTSPIARALLFLVGVALIVAAFVLPGKLRKSEPPILAMPDLVGMTTGAAVTQLNEMLAEVRSDKRWSQETDTEATILGQNPKPGEEFDPLNYVIIDSKGRRWLEGTPPPPCNPGGEQQVETTVTNSRTATVYLWVVQDNCQQLRVTTTYGEYTNMPFTVPPGRSVQFPFRVGATVVVKDSASTEITRGLVVEGQPIIIN